jgi:putative transposase
MINNREKISIRRQCELLSLCRSGLFYETKTGLRDREILNKINEIWQESPFYGYRKIAHELRRRGCNVNLKRIQRIMSENGIFAMIPKKKYVKSSKNKEQKQAFLLNDVEITDVNQVWSTDITYIKLPGGFIYLAAIIDVFSRMIVGYNVSTTMDTELCLKALENALNKYGNPKLINTDQGSQFTASMWIKALKSSNIRISMDGKGRWVDNVYIERLWRTIKHEKVFLSDFQTVKEAKEELEKFIDFYNYKRLHQNLDYKTPNDVYIGGCKVKSFIYAQIGSNETLKLINSV